MNQDNLMCDTGNCGNPAIAFCLNGTLKVKSCEDHMAFLLRKSEQIFKISSYYFVMNHQDAAEFENRKRMKEKGLGNLTAFEANCDQELLSAINAIESTKKSLLRAVESRFEEMKIAVRLACLEAKKQLSKLQTELEQFLNSRESSLSPTAEIVCSILTEPPAFVRFGLADVSDVVSAALSDSWTVNSGDVHSTLMNLDTRQKDAEATLREAVDWARRGIPEALHCANSLLRDEQSPTKGKKKVILELLKVEKRKAEQNFKWLQRSWGLRQRLQIPDKPTIEVGQQFANVLYNQFGRFSEAEQVLRDCYNIVSTPEDALSLCSDICGLYAASEQHEEVEKFGVWVLESFKTSIPSAEHFWKILLYLTISMKRQNQDERAIELLQDWKRRNTRDETNLMKMLRLLTCALGTATAKDAEELLLQARNIGMNHFPTSVFAALTLQYLACVSSEYSQREQYRLQAHSLWEVVAPKSGHAAYNLSCLGDLFMERGRWSEAKKYLQQAQSIWKVAAPKSVAASDNLLHVNKALEAEAQEREEIERAEKEKSENSSAVEQKPKVEKRSRRKK